MHGTGHCLLGAAAPSAPLGVWGVLKQQLRPELRAADSQRTPSPSGPALWGGGDAHSIGKQGRGPGMGRDLAAALPKFRILAPVLGSGCLEWRLWSSDLFNN